MPLSQTLFSPVNMVALVAMIVLLPAVNLFQLSALEEETTDLGNQAIHSQPASPKTDSWIENSWLLAIVLVAVGLFYLGSQWHQAKFSLNLDSVNFIFFMLGLLLHGSPRAFMDSVTEAVPKIAPILIQYPLYAAIMAVLVETGLAQQMSEFFVEHSTKESFPVMSFYSAGLINLFVPSGGGQWAVQAPVVLPAAQELGADIPKTIMAVAWGDAWTNMAQPFWAVPLLTIAGLKIKDILGFCLITLVASGIVLSLIFWLM